MNYPGLINTTESVAKHFYPDTCSKPPSTVRFLKHFQKRLKQGFSFLLKPWHLTANLQLKQWLYSHWKATSTVKLHYISTWLLSISIWYTSLTRLDDSLTKTPFLTAPTNSHDSGATSSEFRKSVLSTPSYQRHLKNEKSRKSKLCITNIRITGWHSRKRWTNEIQFPSSWSEVLLNTTACP